MFCTKHVFKPPLTPSFHQTTHKEEETIKTLYMWVCDISSFHPLFHTLSRALPQSCRTKIRTIMSFTYTIEPISMYENQRRKYFIPNNMVGMLYLNISIYFNMRKSVKLFVCLTICLDLRKIIRTLIFHLLSKEIKGFVT